MYFDSGFATNDPATQTHISYVATGVSSNDDVAIDRNRLYIRNMQTGEYWNGNAWVGSWWWFAPTGQEAWEHTLNLDAGEYQVFAWTWDTANQRTRTSQLITMT